MFEIPTDTPNGSPNDSSECSSRDDFSGWFSFFSSSVKLGNGKLHFVFVAPRQIQAFSMPELL